jgi:hypothetical protein
MLTRILLLVAVFIFHPLAVNANSRAIEIRNSFNSSLDDYTKYIRKPKLKCMAFSNAKFSAERLMSEGPDASLAKKWNSMLPSTGCNLTPLIIDASATNKLSDPEPNEGLSLRSCSNFQEIMSIHLTQEINTSCPGGGSIYIKAR